MHDIPAQKVYKQRLTGDNENYRPLLRYFWFSLACLAFGSVHHERLTVENPGALLIVFAEL